MAIQSFSSDEYIKSDGCRFDVLKLVLAAFVVGIHSQLTQILQPIFRLGVPVFFIMTSYFFFLKQSRLRTRDEQKAAMKNYALRILKLYLFWFIVLLPLIIYYREWYVDPGPGTIIKVLQCFLFSSTFKASWFLMASLLNILLVWFLSDRARSSILVIVGVIFYVICCLTSNYYYICQAIPGFEQAYMAYISVFTVPFNSFPVALIFVLAGKYLAEHHVFVTNKHLIPVVILGFVMLYVEYSCLDHHRVINNDCYFSLLPLSVALFMLIGQNYIKVDYDTKKLRQYSTVMFCLHASIVPAVKGATKHLFWSVGVDNGDVIAFVAFIVTILFCVVLTRVLVEMSRHERFGFVKYSY